MKRMKIINTTRVMQQIGQNKTMSHVDFSRALGLNRSTVSNIISELIEVGVVLEDSIGESTVIGGRKPIHLRLNNRSDSLADWEYTRNPIPP
jgi:predicted transcriptional regulator